MKRLVVFVFAIAMIVLALIGRAGAHSHAFDSAKAIVASDEAGKNITVDAAALKYYVSRHTGSSVQYSLIGSYNRDVAAAKAQAAAANGTGALYAQAQASCASRADSIRQANCVQAYIAAHGTAQSQAAPIAAPNPQSYINILRAPDMAADLPTTAFILGLVAVVYGFIIRKRG